MIHHHVPNYKDASIYIWEITPTTPFNELILSWNALRPSQGWFAISLSMRTHAWSDWTPYACWGHAQQNGSKTQLAGSPLKIEHDIAEITDGQMASGFRVKLVAHGGANLKDLFALHAFTSTKTSAQIEALSHFDLPSIHLAVPAHSQMALGHVDSKRICSATSTAAAVHFLTKTSLDPIEFAVQVKDDKHNIYGNWVLNVAHASAVLKKGWQCWVQKLDGFEALHRRLQSGSPVVVSVKGPLAGGATPYQEGHLMVAMGYDRDSHKVLCMDPAFPTDQDCHVAYNFDEFMTAWKRRDMIAYVFERAQNSEA